MPTFAVATPDGPVTGLPDYAAWRDGFAPCELPRQLAPGSIVYTSGTTGRPKGVQRVPASAEQQARMQALRSAMYQITPLVPVVLDGVIVTGQVWS